MNTDTQDSLNLDALKQAGEVEIARYWGLPDLVRKGWQVIGSFTETRLASYPSDRNCGSCGRDPRLRHTCGMHGGRRPYHEHTHVPPPHEEAPGSHVVTEQFFLLARNPDETLARLNERIAEFKTTGSRHEREASAAKRAQEGAEKKLAAAESEKETLSLELRTAQDNTQKALDHASRMENDIAKIRQEIGDGRMREILEGK